MKYFTIPELTASAKARALGIDNTPPPGVKVKLSKSGAARSRSTAVIGARH